MMVMTITARQTDIVVTETGNSSPTNITAPANEPGFFTEGQTMHYLSTCSGCSKTYPADLESCPHCGNWIDPQPAALDVRDWGWDLET